MRTTGNAAAPCSTGSGFALQRSEQKNAIALQLAAALKRCSKARDLAFGKRLHLDAVAAGVHTNDYVAATLIAMYGKCGRMELAQQVFDGLIRRDVVVWTSLILGYVQNGQSSSALDLFTRMECRADAVTYVAALKACSGLAVEDESRKDFCLRKGIAVHKQATECGFDSGLFVANALIDMYNKCGSMHYARQVFDRMASKDVISWNSLIMGYVQNAECLRAMDIFNCMDCEADSATYVALLKACGSLASEKECDGKHVWLRKGIAIHKQIKQRGFGSYTVVSGALIDMYSKCGDMDSARKVFDRIVSKSVVMWNTLIAGYVQNGKNSVAIDLLTAMDCRPDSYTYPAVLKACGVLASEQQSDKQFWLEKGIAIHKEAKERGFDSHSFVATTLIEMYSKCGSMDRAREVFNRMASKSIVTWNTLIGGCVQNGENSLAMDLFTAMDCKPSSISYVAVLKACGNLAAQPAGQQIHAQVCKLGLEKNPLVATSLMDFYCKCGSMSNAEDLFNNMDSLDTVSWSALIAGYSSLGDSAQVFSLVKKMQASGLQVDEVIFSCVLTACSRSGLVQQGTAWFNSVLRSGNVPLRLEHYSCVVDMLGRANRVQEALEIIKSMPFEADSIIWRTLLGACSKCKNTEVGKIAFDAIVAAGTANAAAYVLMGDIYRSLNMLGDLERVDVGRKKAQEHDLGKGKLDQCWWCDSQGRMYEFVLGDAASAEVIEKLQTVLSPYF